MDFDSFFGLTFKQLSNSGPPGGRLVWSSRLYPTACSWHGGLLDTAETLDGTDQRGFFLMDGSGYVSFLLVDFFSLKPVYFDHAKSFMKHYNKEAKKKFAAQAFQ